MVYTYTSTRADFNPAKTILVLPPSKQACTLKDAKDFAESSGWQLLAEYEEAVLIVPVIEKGYASLSVSYPGELLAEMRNSFKTLCGRSLYQRGDSIWCWECLVYLAGYEDGADFAGNAVVAEPARYAAAALIGGAPTDYTRGDHMTSHPFLKQVSGDYVKRNREIESRIWMYCDDESRARKAREYFWRDRELTVKSEPERYDLNLASEIMTDLFNKTVRWKDGPDGTVTDYPGRVSFYNDNDFIIEKVSIGVTDYPVAVHLPKGMNISDVGGLALVFSVHGRGEPAWLFATKNGWDKLADETREFVLAVPDSPGNLWQLERDMDAFPAMVDMLCTKYDLDRSRVYITGFSNGAMMTREIGSAHPELFAAISPWNGPVHLKEKLDHPVFLETLISEGYEMPAWICVGDRDPAASTSSVTEQLEYILPANGCRAERDDNTLFGLRFDETRTKDNYYTGENGYLEGDRFNTFVYRRQKDYENIVCATVMKNMPHGAICEESRACYEFIKRFRRINGSKEITVL